MGKPFKDLTGQRFGKLTVIKSVKKQKGSKIMWQCKCDCGNTKEVLAGSLISGGTKSCGCLYMKDITGQRFGRLVAIRPLPGRLDRVVVWECLCDCGNPVEVRSTNLRSGITRSCGCLAIDDLTGQRFGKLVVLHIREERDKRGLIWWMAKCDCGNTVAAQGHRLRAGKTKSCGCLKTNSNLTEEQRAAGRIYPKYKKWRKEVYERDNYTCQYCGDSVGGNLNAHHIEGYNNNPKLRTDLGNGVTLCEECHLDFHHQYGYGDNTREQFEEWMSAEGNTDDY